MAFKMKGDPFKRNFGIGSPAKHTTNRVGHERKYGKGHENDAHPTYWKKKMFTDSDHEEEGVASDKELDLIMTTGKRVDDNEKNPYRAYKGGKKEYDDFEDVLSSRTDADISRSQRGKKYEVGNYNEKTGDYDVTEVKKNKTEKKTEKKSTSKKKLSYEASYTDAVAEKWKDKGGKEAYIKAAKAWNAKNRK
jgi:hypothetical protein